MTVSAISRNVWSETSFSGQVDEEGTASPEAERLSRRISLEITRIDRMISSLLDSILHHPRFQQLEANWRGLSYLVNQVPLGARVRIQVLNVTWKALARDFDRSAEFDSSQLFRMVYSETFGTAGGLPFGMLIGAYEIHPRPSAEHPISDLSVVNALSQVAAAAFSPFVASAHPTLLGVDSWSELERPVDLQRTFDQLEFVKWQQARSSEDMNFVGLALPRILLREPYVQSHHGGRLVYRERVTAEDSSDLLWGNAAFAFGAVVIRSFSDTEWMTSIRGTTKSANEDGVAEGVAETGGLVTGLPVRYFPTDRHRVQPLPSVDVNLSEDMERELANFGFIGLTAVRNTPWSAFYSNRSIRQIPKVSTEVAANNHAVASQLQYVLCVSRFSHFLKIIARDMIGGYADAESLQDFLNAWLRQYITQDPQADPETRARYPLREAVVRVRELPGQPGVFTSEVHLWPHSELDELTGAVTFTSELTPGRK